MTEPKISIIVPAYNVEKTIKRCIESLLRLNYGNYEIIIVDDGSTDATKQILSGYKEKISVMALEHRGPSHCRNRAVSESKAEYVAFTDADCIVDKNWLKELLIGFSGENIAAVGGSQLSPDDETAFGRRVQLFFELTGFLGGYIKKSRRNSLSKVPHNPSCNVMYRREALLAIGGFDEWLWPGEDVDLDYRLAKKGFVLLFNPRAIIYHYRPGSLKKVYSMMCRYGVVQAILTKRYGFFRKIQFVPIFFLFLILLFIRDASFLLLIPILYLFLFLKTKDFVTANFVFVFILMSLLFWNLGFFKGMLFLKNLKVSRG